MGSLEDVGPDVCKQVYMDLEYRKKWDEYVKGKSIILRSKNSLCQPSHNLIP